MKLSNRELKKQIALIIVAKSIMVQAIDTIEKSRGLLPVDIEINNQLKSLLNECNTFVDKYHEDKRVRDVKPMVTKLFRSLKKEVGGEYIDIQLMAILILKRLEKSLLHDEVKVFYKTLNVQGILNNLKKCHPEDWWRVYLIHTNFVYSFVKSRV